MASFRVDEVVRMVRVVFLHPDLGIGGAERLIVDCSLALQSKVQIYSEKYIVLQLAGDIFLWFHNLWLLSSAIDLNTSSHKLFIVFFVSF